MTARYMIYLPADAPGRLIRCNDGDTCKLETLQQLVGGLIETADSCLEPDWARELVDSIKLIVNEEGLLQELPINWKAMELYQYGYMSGIKEGYWSTAKKDELVQRLGQYEDTGLTPEEVRQLSRKDNRFQTFNPD